LATKLHNQMTGADLHPDAIDGTTGTELSVASQGTYDTRYVRTIGGMITPTANGTATLRVTRQDGTTTVLAVDTTGNQVIVGTSSGGGNLQLGDNTISKAVGAFFNLGSGLRVSGPLQMPASSKTAAYTIGASDSLILADGTSAAFTVTLPNAGSLTGEVVTIKRTNSVANNITVGTTSSQTIDGATTKTLGAQWSSITVQSSGTSWYITSLVGTVS